MSGNSDVWYCVASTLTLRQYAHPTHHPTIAFPEGVSLSELRSVMVMRTRGAPGPTLTPSPGWKCMCTSAPRRQTQTQM
jgi:hypothetical protein